MRARSAIRQRQRKVGALLPVAPLHTPPRLVRANHAV